jgi:pyruvate dehydrogenase E2 component (dihydrolipoamide acetyltransferase)
MVTESEKLVPAIAVSEREASPFPEFQAGMRRAIAAAMSLSNREIPHYYLETRIDMSHPLQ